MVMHHLMLLILQLEVVLDCFWNVLVDSSGDITLMLMVRYILKMVVQVSLLLEKCCW